MNPFWMEHFCNFFFFPCLFRFFFRPLNFQPFCFLVAIINAASHVLPATGVICRKKETKGGCGIPANRLFRPVPLASWQPACRRWRLKSCTEHGLCSPVLCIQIAAIHYHQKDGAERRSGTKHNQLRGNPQLTGVSVDGIRYS